MTGGDRLATLAPATSEALVLEHVTRRFGGVVATDDLSLTVAPGEAVGVIGPNGAGKSTLLRLVAGVLQPSSGTICYGDRSLRQLPPHDVNRLGVGLANQIPCPFRALTVEENLRVAATASRAGRRSSQKGAVGEVLAACQLDALARTPAGQLGLLDLKRLELGRVLASGARTLLLDEVAAGLVGKELTAAIELIRAIHASGRSLVIVEHVQRVIEEVVDRVVVLDWGRLIADGTPAEVASDPHVRKIYLGSSAEGTLRSAVPAPAPRSAPLLSIDGLTAGYGSLVALSDVSCTIGEGEIVSILGANGAGKSTLARAISGHVPARAGRILWRDRPVTTLAAYERARLGIAHSPEGRRIFSEHTVRENLLLGSPRRASRARRADRLDWVLEVLPALRRLAGRRAGMLSGGEQQMLAIGRALMAEPSLLVCDELSLGLAPAIVDSLYETLLEVQRHGIALLLIEQNTHRSLAISGSAYVLHRGRVTYAGSPDPLLDEAFLADRYFAAPGAGAVPPAEPPPGQVVATSHGGS